MAIPKRRKLSKEERMKVYEKCQGHCAYCGCTLEYKDMQVDHVKPVYRGGEDDISNMLTRVHQVLGRTKKNIQDIHSPCKHSI